MSDFILCFFFVIFAAGSAHADDLPVVAPALAQVASCPDSFAKLQLLSLDLSTAFTDIQKITPALIRGEQTPTWDDFALLQSIVDGVRNGKKTVIANGKLADLKASISDLLKVLPDNPALVAIRDASKGAKPSNLYKPTEYELKRAYQNLLWQLNHELPPELKIRGVHIPLDPRRKTLATQTTALMQGLDKDFMKFYPTTGYATPEAFHDAFIAAGDGAKLIDDILLKENVEITMNRPSSARWWVPKTGFQNQHVTGSSKGYLGDVCRDHVEAGLLNKTYEDFSPLDDDMKPKYGSIRPKDGAGVDADNEVTSQYGDDLYTFKLDRIRDRLTVTTGDSLNRAAGYYVTDMMTTTAAPSSWDHLFIPWKYRELLGPDLLGAASSKVWRVNDESGPTTWSDVEKNALAAFKKAYSNNRSAYLEAQIYGRLSLDDVETFTFNAEAPTGDFLKELQKRKIRIIDGTKAIPSDWQAPSP